MPTDNLKVAFTCPDAPATEGCQVPRFTGTEEINGLFRFEIDVFTGRDNPLSLEELVGRRATLSMDRGGNVRDVHGVISQAEYVRTDLIPRSKEISPFVRVTLRSGLWPMSLSRRYRVFDGMTNCDVIQMVCGEHQITCDLASTGSPPLNLVQYGESDLDLVTRLLASEGLLWLPVEEESATKLRAVNSYASLDQEVAADFALTLGHGFLNRFESRLRTVAGEYRFTSTDAFRPRAPVSDTATVQDRSGAIMSFADHPIGVRNPSGTLPARKPARLLADRAGALAKAAEGASTIPLVAAGASLEVRHHPIDGLNAKWVLIEVSHTWTDPETKRFLDGKDDRDDQDDGSAGAPAEGGGKATHSSSYANEFTCVRKDGALLHPKLEAPPKVHGLRLGVVCGNGEGGQRDIPGDTVSSGIYGVKFPSEDNLIQYMRVAHPWAGPERGFHFPLEVGDEVVVGHEHGDPGRPFILGSLHGVENLGPVVSTEGGKGYSGVLRSRTGHEVRFDDDPALKRILLKSGSGDHQLEFHDTDKKTALTTTGLLEEKVGGDHTSAVDGNRTTTIKKNDEVAVEGDRKLAITKGEIHTVGEDHALTVTGAENHSVGKDLTQKVDGASVVTIAKDASLTIKGAHTIDVTKDLAATVSGGIVLEATKSFSGSGKTITLEADDTLTLKCGSAKIVLEKNGNITIDGGKITVKGSGDVAIKGSKTAVN